MCQMLADMPRAQLGKNDYHTPRTWAGRRGEGCVYLLVCHSQTVKCSEVSQQLCKLTVTHKPGTTKRWKSGLRFRHGHRVPAH